MCFTVITILSHINMLVSMIIREKSKNFIKKNFIFNSTHDHRLNKKKHFVLHNER